MDGDMTKYGLLCAGAALALGAPAFAQAQTIDVETVPPTLTAPAPADTLSPPGTTVLVVPGTRTAIPTAAPPERWVSGRYAWDPASGQYVWVPDHHYVEAPAEVTAAWVPGHYAATDDGYVWVAGHWR
jgi:hypothetical protein